MIALEQQSPDIAAGVHVNRREEDIGAGDQVMTRQVLPAGTLCRHVFGTRWRWFWWWCGALEWLGTNLAGDGSPSTNTGDVRRRRSGAWNLHGVLWNFLWALFYESDVIASGLQRSRSSP